MSAARPASVVGRVVGFVRLARDNGFALGVRETLDALALARTVDLARPHQLRWGLRALLCARAGDWRRFDELFDAYWLGRGVRRLARVSGELGRGAPRLETGGPAGERTGLPDRPPGTSADAAAEGAGRREGASAAESLSRTDLRHIRDPEALARVHALTERMARTMKQRLTRRRRLRARGERIDLRNTIHKSLAHGGTPLRLAFRKRWPKPLRLVVILDVSGSMSLYSSFFVRFLRGVIDNFRAADAYVFHTRLVHISPALRERNLERAVERMSLLSAGWSGGTRIGESLRTFNQGYAAKALNGRTVVIVVSDGYDTGEPELLAEQLRVIRRRARRLIWLNPMIGWRGYAPLAQGMAAALPHVDLFAPAHDLESLMALEPYLARL